MGQTASGLETRPTGRRTRRTAGDGSLSSAPWAESGCLRQAYALRLGYADGEEVACRLAAPYILPGAEQPTGEKQYQPWEFGEEALRHDLEKLFGHGWPAAHIAPEGNGCLSGLTNVEYDYISRWCYEDNKRHNRLALMPEARFALRFDTLPDPAELQELAWGFGEWSFAGFGAIGPPPP
jgi:hypothetical protein